MFTPESYTNSLFLFFRLLGAIYFFAFGAFIFQSKGLFGKNGILPISEHLNFIKKHYPKQYFHLIPSLFWFNRTDQGILSVFTIGTVLSVFLMCGIYPSLILLLLYLLYLSVVSAGQEFLSFGWEGFLLEVTLNAFFLSLSPTPNLLVWISLNLVLFRFHIQAGAVKLQSKDPNWRNLEAIFYHYQSQPIPNAIAWYVHKLPMWFHKLSTLIMFFIELIVPFGMFGPDWMRFAVFILFAGLQWAIWLTGNFSYLNHLTVALSVILIANPYLSWLEIPITTPTSLPTYISSTLAGAFLIALQGMQLWQHFFPNILFHQWLKIFSPYHLANRYGIFAVMTTKRYEIIFEGSDDQVVWKEYTFFHKPSEVTRRPKRVSPYQPRLDWQAWFLPFSTPENQPWIEQFIYHLLKGTPEVLNLIKSNPFPSQPPKYVRAVIYDYVFTNFEEKKKTGAWWKREYLGEFCPPLSNSSYAK